MVHCTTQLIHFEVLYVAIDTAFGLPLIYEFNGAEEIVELWN